MARDWSRGLPYVLDQEAIVREKRGFGVGEQKRKRDQVYCWKYVIEDLVVVHLLMCSSLVERVFASASDPTVHA